MQASCAAMWALQLSEPQLSSSSVCLVLHPLHTKQIHPAPDVATSVNLSRAHPALAQPAATKSRGLAWHSSRTASCRRGRFTPTTNVLPPEPELLAIWAACGSPSGLCRGLCALLGVRGLGCCPAGPATLAATGTARLADGACWVLPARSVPCGRGAGCLGAVC